ncbi:MAG TPA: class F sortase [Actinomycetes bacterium]|nr:class F sortase [Actinomycetes bacterium]
MKRTGAVLVAVVMATSSFWLATGGHAVAQPVPTSSTRSTAATGCPTTLSKPLTPKRITVQGVTTKAKVIMPKRLAGRVPGDPPLTEAGKEMFAFDKYTGIYPGTPFGVVRMNAHVWPDGSAVGNRMLKNLKIGNRIVVFGLTKKICYRVVDKVVVDANKTLLRYYRTDGKPRLGIVVCSGKRLGPGNWTKRTVWFAKPSR